MRVAIVTHGFAVGGGVPTAARWLQSGLSRRSGVSVDMHDLATSRRDPHSRRILSPKTWRKPLGPYSDVAWDATFWGASASEVEVMRYRARRELSEQLSKYDLIQVVAGTPAWGLPVLGLDVPVVLQVATLAKWERKSSERTGQLVDHPRRLMTRWNSKLEPRALLGADCVFVMNTAMKDHATRIGQSNVVLVQPGIDTSKFQPTGSWSPDGYLLSVCRFGDLRKGLPRIVQAYAELKAALRHAPPLVLAGRGTVPDSLHREIRQSGLSGDEIVIRQDVPQSELPGLYRGASVYLQASYEEGLGISVLEAQSSGVPVVATATDGTRETINDGVTGFLVEQRSDRDVVAGLVAKVEQILDGDGYGISQRAREWVVGHHSEAVALDRYLQVYRGLVS